MKKIGEYETLEVGFVQSDVTLMISGNGVISFDYGTHGEEMNVFRQEEDENEKLAQNTMACNTEYAPSKLEKLSMYLHLLYDAQKVEHAVHAEIAEALKKFREEAGI